MITFFTIPKAFNGHFNIIQRNAIKSWSLLSNNCEILLFGNDAGAKDVAQEYGVKHIVECETTNYGTPRIDYVFLQAQKLAQNNLLCYINTDIILMSDFINTIEKLKSSLKNFLLIGQRVDLEINELLIFHNQWESGMLDRIGKQGKWHGPAWIDYFLFNKGLWKTIPPFAVGRTVWDNWLIYEARRQNADVIDATKRIHAIHQTHDYSHSKGGTTTVWKGEEAKKNLELANGYRYCFTIQDSTHVLSKDERCIPVRLTLHLFRKLEVWIILRPKLLAIIDMFRKRKFNKHKKAY